MAIATNSASVALLHTPRAAGLARTWIAEHLLAWERDEDIDTAMLVVGELVTNAVRYSSGPPILTIEVIGDSLRCSVHDDNAAHPVMMPPYRYVESGRGMWLIAGLSSSWGVDSGGAYPDGKVVWCVLCRDANQG